MRHFLSIFIVVLCILGVPFSKTQATYDPLSVPNNKFGIHIADPNDLAEAAQLVNSTGGDWGYVVMVIQDNDRSTDKWQSIFNQLRRLHLIPIIRIATHPEGDSWKIPTPEDASRWADFLNSLLWPTKNRYVVFFNEPNHGKEWGNRIDPEGYADIFSSYAKEFREYSSDFFILPAGLDFSAQSDGLALNASEYLERIVAKYPDFFSAIDGWTSHSYPNPGFSGSPYAIGRGSIASFVWEISFAQSLGLSKPLPVFITETGWIHDQGKTYIPSYLSPTQVGINLQTAARSTWNDARIAAVVPFLFNYQDMPFDHFSFKTIGNTGYYDHAQYYTSIQKTEGKPRQNESLTKQDLPLIPDKLVSNTISFLDAQLTNTGQGIIDPFDGYSISFTEESGLISASPNSVPYLEPGQTGTFSLTVKTPKTEGSYPVTLSVVHDGVPIYTEKTRIIVVPPPSITISLIPGWKQNKALPKVKCIVYDSNEKIVYEAFGSVNDDGKATFSNVTHVIPEKTYRVVIVTPYYLPRQQTVTIHATHNLFAFPRLYPLDFNTDGTLSWQDIPSLLQQKPYEILLRFF